MDDLLRRCLLVSIGALALVGMLSAVGAPGAVLLGLAQLALCLGVHLLMDHGTTHGRGGPASTQHAGASRDGGTDAADPSGSTR
jgi:hypothetical protein